MKSRAASNALTVAAKNIWHTFNTFGPTFITLDCLKFQNQCMPNLAITIALESDVIGNIRADIALAGLGWVLRMGQKADRFGGFFAWVKKPTVSGGSSQGLELISYIGLKFKGINRYPSRHAPRSP